MQLPDFIATAPGALPVVGHAFQLLRDPLGFLQTQRKLGPVVKVRLGRGIAYVVTRPDLARRVLMDEGRSYDKGGPIMNAGRLLLGNGLVVCSNADHPRLRALMQPAFHPSRLPAYAAVMRQCAVEVTDSWRPGQQIAMNVEMQRLATLTLARTLISTEQSVEATLQVVRILPIVLKGVYRRMAIPLAWVHRLPTPENRRYLRAQAQIRAIADQLIAQYRSSDIEDDSLLSRIMRARNEDTGQRLDDQEISDQIVTILAAGTETSASLLAWTFHLLAQHPEIERRLRAEVDSIVHGRPAAFEDLAKLPYLRQILTETLRLYPPTPLLSRTTLAEVELGGYRLPAGADVLVSVHAQQRDPEIFADPDRFDPDRWLPERATATQRAGFLSLGMGHRKCIGDVFGLTEASISLAIVVGRWRLHAKANARVTPVMRMALHPSSLQMTVEERKRPNLDRASEQDKSKAILPLPPT